MKFLISVISSAWLIVGVTLTSSQWHTITPQKEANWHEAMMYCRRYNMFLVTIESEAKQQMVAEKMNLEGWTYMWTSATDQQEEGIFRWLSTGKKLEYVKWAFEQPDNAGANENCVHVNCNKNWNDLSCERKLNFICEHPPAEEWIEQSQVPSTETKIRSTSGSSMGSGNVFLFIVNNSLPEQQACNHNSTSPLSPIV